MKMKLTLLLALFFIGGIVKAQTITITDPDYDPSNPINCTLFDDGGVQNFFDSGGSGGNYGDNENQTIVICPDLVNGSKVTLSFGINIGFQWNVDGSDTVYVYDGPSTASPLLGAHNSVTDPNGFSHVASFNNPTGCLTVVFHSDAAVVGTGWMANVTCGDPVQPFVPHISGFINGQQPNAMNPSDTGYVDICFEDSVMLVANPDFPYSSQANLVNYGIAFGYAQSNSNCTFVWNFSDGTTQNGDTVWFSPSSRSGYLVTLRITDPLGLIEVIKCKIRVSTIPSFAGTMPEDDTICLGDITHLIGGVTQTDTVGVDPTQGAFEIGGVFAGLTYLPDGSGLTYTTSVTISDFLPGQTITSASDIVNMCVTMEHSFLGDLEMGLTCPNGTMINIFNAYPATGLFAGGFGGGGTFLGEADDNGNGTPGIGYEYCFQDGSPWGTLGQEFAGGNTVTLTAPPSPSAGQAMSPGTYDPEVSFASFIGCPINGNWTLTVRDNQSIDDGYIFEWGIFFNPAINPNTEFYTPVITSENWLSDPDIIAGQNDTAVVISPTTVGNHYYTYQVTDNFGCTYDTTIRVTVVGLPALPAGDSTCNLSYLFSGVTAPGAVVWTVDNQPAGSNVTFTPSASSLNPSANVDLTGNYSYTITDLMCNNQQTVVISYLEDPNPVINDDTACIGDGIILDAAWPGSSYLWNDGSTSPMLGTTTSGTYIVNVTNICATKTDTAVLFFEDCEITIPNVFSPNADGANDVFEILGLDNNPNTHVQIFDRWGILVYETANYLNDWKGINQNSGKKLPDGVYFYIVTMARNDRAYNGTVTILTQK